MLIYLHVNRETGHIRPEAYLNGRMAIDDLTQGYDIMTICADDEGLGEFTGYEECGDRQGVYLRESQ